MSDSNDPRPADQATTLLRKILNRLGGKDDQGNSAATPTTSGLTDAQLRATPIQTNPRKLTLVDDFVSVGGDTAVAATDTGAPVKVGGKATSSEPSPVSTGQRVNQYFDTFGRAHNITAGNDEVTLLASASRTTLQTGATSTNEGANGIVVMINITAFTSGSITVSIKGIDVLSGNTYTILASAALAATGFTVLKVYPGLPISANASANDVLPRKYRIDVAVGDATPITYSVKYYLQR